MRIMSIYIGESSVSITFTNKTSSVTINASTWEELKTMLNDEQANLLLGLGVVIS